MVKWVPLVELPGYWVSENGDVFSDKSARNLKPRKIRGYWAVGPTDKDGRQLVRKVHRLVCRGFHGPPPPGKNWVLHNNGNPLDNRADNLRWGDATDNARDRSLHGNCHESNRTHCPEGHEYTADNTFRSRGLKAYRICRVCRSQHKLNARARGLLATDERHGSPTGYFNHGCRCDLCTQAALEYNKFRKTNEKENNND